MSLKDFVELQKLGEGSFARVYKVRRLSDQQVYAIKKISLHSIDHKLKENSLNQIRLLASLSHPNIITYHQAFYDDHSKLLCLVMEYADNGDLLKKVNKNGRKKQYFSEAQIWKVLISVSRGLDYLHQRSILHRDIKSENIFIVENQYKIGDMNVSKVKKNDLKLTQTGTPYYASPQVWNDSGYDEKSDIWSLGCVLYEMLTLKPPFLGTTMKDLFEQVTQGRPKPIPKHYSNQISNIVFSCLRKDPRYRPTASQLLKNLTTKIYQNLVLNQESWKGTEENSSLLKTINFLQKDLNKCLPQSNYSEKKNNENENKAIRQGREKTLNDSILLLVPSPKKIPEEIKNEKILCTPEQKKHRSLPRTEKSLKKVKSVALDNILSEKKPQINHQSVKKIKNLSSIEDNIQKVFLSKVPKIKSRQCLLKQLLEGRKQKKITKKEKSQMLNKENLVLK